MKPTSPTAGPRRRSTALLVGVISLSLLPAPIAYAQKTAQAAAQTPAGAARFRGEPVTLNFVNADIEGVTRAMSVILKQQFVVDPRVKGNITVYSEQALTPREAYFNFLAALRGLGFTVVEVGGLFKVVPEADAKLQSGTVSIGEVSRKGDQIITQIFKLTHENANNLVPVLRPLISPNNTINANPGNNSLIITDYADNLVRIAKIIATMDTPAAGDVEVIVLKHAVAADIAQLVQKLTDPSTAAAGGVPGAAGATSTGGASIIVEPRSNALLVRAPNAARLASIRNLVDKLDQPGQGSNPMGNIWVVYLKNADATKLATVLRASFSAGSGGASGGSTASPLTAASPTQTAGGATPATAPLAASAGPSTGGFIQADPTTNSLVITGSEPLYRQLRTVIDQLDTRRAQVYIESMIVEVSGDDAANFGLQWQGLLGKSGDRNGVFAGTNFGTTGNLITIDKAGATGDLSGVSLGEGLNIGLITKIAGVYGIGAIANILRSRANTNIVSTPNLITMDNEEAKIIVGSNVPFVTGTTTTTGTGTSNPFQTIERKDVGITLRIKPQIGEGGTVRMSIFQESSSVSDKVAPGTSNAGPSTNKRSIESNVIVDDGQILVLGGLIEDKFTENRTKVPLLGDIPFIGALFRSESRTKTRTNLMVFLRPMIMRDADSAAKISLDRYDLIRGQQIGAQPPSSITVPINESPVLPPLHAVEGTIAPLNPAPEAAKRPYTPASAASN